MDDLKPCPFCGGKAKIIYPSNTLKPTLIHVSEKACYANGWREYDTEAEAIEAWNTRADDYRHAAEYWQRMYENTVTERTCRIEIDKFGCYPCSACGVDIPSMFVDRIDYCPYCGAKVVSE